ncbi:signal peptidase I [Sphaerisporangium fuscum]|uniref:signal peptidase I n=1 Tax=Sphaerisporangium fuscum TaxID=2835868 RepID=UPI001BDD409A|nr:signal peptidase I [Sphaerisporangium fuscum]
MNPTPTAGEPRRAARRIQVAGSAAARATLGVLVGLLTWSQLPTLLPGWQATVILTGSMGPAIDPGDVVVYDHIPARTLVAGQVVLLRDPADPDRLLTHRVHRVLPDGRIVTAGDANPRPDSTASPARNILGIGRLRVPWIGMPVLWWRQARYELLALTALGLLALAWLATRRPDAPSQEDGDA